MNVYVLIEVAHWEDVSVYAVFDNEEEANRICDLRYDENSKLDNGYEMYVEKHEVFKGE